MKIAIYGAGSLGTVLGSFIARKNVQIDLISRNEKHINALKENGAHIIGTIDFTQKVNALLVQEMKEKYDIIFLMTKQQNNKEVASFLKDFLTSSGVLVTFQNGLPEKALAEVLGETKVMGCTVEWGAQMVNPGVVKLTSNCDALTFSLGTLIPNHPKIEEIKKILELMGKVEINPNFIGVRWSKLLVNSAFSGMSTVLGCTFGEVAKIHISHKIVQKMIKECIDVCKGLNITIEPIQGKNIVKLFDYQTKFKQFISYILIPFAIKKHKLIKASMLQDIEKGKKCEVDAINGSVCQSGLIAGVPTPFNDKVVHIIHYIEEGKLSPSINNIILFNDII